MGQRISAWLAERRAVLAPGGRFGDFEGHAVHFVAVEEEVGGVRAVVVEGEVVEVDDEGGGGFEVVDRVHEVNGALDGRGFGAVGVHDDDPRLFGADLGLVRAEAGDDAEAGMAGREAGAWIWSKPMPMATTLDVLSA